MTVTPSERGKSLEHAAFLALVFAAGSVLFSLPLGRLGIAAGLLMSLLSLCFGCRYGKFQSTTWLMFLFVAITVAATCMGVDPRRGLSKIDKLVWWLAMPLAAAHVHSVERFRKVLMAFMVGGVVLSVKILGSLPFEYADAMARGWAHGPEQLLIHLGSMTDGQRLLVSIPISIGLISMDANRRRKAWEVGGLALQILAFILMFKRGSWISAGIVVGLWLWIRYGWKAALLLLGTVLLLCLTVPILRERAVDLRNEADAGRGGRILMWTRVAPKLIRAYPMGVGYRCLTNQIMRKIAREVEPHRDHLHSNILQILVETGWVGLGIYLVWMAAVIRDGWRWVQSSTLHGEEWTLAWFSLLALSGLMLNGLVEYNMGDAEIVLLYGLLMGCAARGALRVAGGVYGFRWPCRRLDFLGK